MDLKPCPSTPNCISSTAEPSDSQHYMPPINYPGTAVAALDAVVSVLKSTGNSKIVNRSTESVEAVFTTRLLRFKDDVTFAIDDERKELHFRSASRVGHSDLGANRKRLNALVPLIQAELGLAGRATSANE